MDGTINLAQQQWKSMTGVAAPLNTGDPQHLLCPLCVRLGRMERLQTVSAAAIFGCARGHRFDSEPTRQP